MTTLEALIRLRDNLKEWVTNNLNAIGKPKASDVSIEPIEGLSAATAQDALEVLNSKIKFKEVSVKFDGGKASISEPSITANSVVMAIRKVVDGQLSSVALSACARNGGAYLCAYTTADTALTATVDVYLMWTTV